MKKIDNDNAINDSNKNIKNSSCSSTKNQEKEKEKEKEKIVIHKYNKKIKSHFYNRIKVFNRKIQKIVILVI